MVLLMRKLYLYFKKDPEAVHYFPGAGGGGGGGGCPTFSRGGVQMLISIETHIRTCYFPRGVSGPPIPLWIRTWECHHNETIFITVNCQAMICQD